MAVRDDLVEALSTCIDRLNQGETVETILADYPLLANQLRPMLEAGLLFPRVRIPPIEVQTTEQAGEIVIRQTVHQVFGDGFRWIWLVIVLVIFGSVVLGVLWNNRSGSNTALIDIPTVTVTEKQPSPTFDTVTPELTETPSVTASLMYTSTSVPSTATPVVSVTPEIAQITINGPITAINEHTITIYDFVLTFAPDNPILTVIQVGDVVEVEGIYTEGSIQIIELTFTNILVIVQDSLVWRGDDCEISPPVWAQDFAADWYASCESDPTENEVSGDSDFEHDDDDEDDDDD